MESRFDRLEQAHLDQATYEELLRLWQLKGYAHLRAGQGRRLAWRDNFCRRLKEAGQRSRSLILEGQPAGSERQSVGDRLTKSNNDPLFFANQLGVSPLEFLGC
jgi:hypothetical protein